MVYNQQPVISIRTRHGKQVVNAGVAGIINLLFLIGTLIKLCNKNNNAFYWMKKRALVKLTFFKK